MPVFHAIQCYQCSAFQVQQVKKVPKFACSLCGAKQSVRQVYAISGKASDVRGVVVSLNARKQAADEVQDSMLADDACYDAEQVAPSAVHAPVVDWRAYEEQDAAAASADVRHSGPGEEQYVTELPEHAGRKGRGKRKIAHTDADTHGERGEGDMAGKGMRRRALQSAANENLGRRGAWPGGERASSMHQQARRSQGGGQAAAAAPKPANGSLLGCSGLKQGLCVPGSAEAGEDSMPRASAAAKTSVSKWGDFDEGDEENGAPPQQLRKAQQQAPSSSWVKHADKAGNNELAIATTWD